MNKPQKYLIGNKIAQMSLSDFKCLAPTLPKLLGVSEKTIYRDKKGIEDIPGHRLSIWAKILNCSMEELICTQTIIS